MGGINVAIIGVPKSGHTVPLETLPYGTVDFSFDKDGYQSLIRDRTKPIKGRRPKNVIVRKRLQEWLEKEEYVLKPDDILVIDYVEYKDEINLGKLPTYSSSIIHAFIQDANMLWKPQAAERGICHIAADSLTGLEYQVLEYVVKLNTREMLGTSQYDYGLAIEKMREVILSLVSMPFDFVLTCHVEGEKDEVTGRVFEQPLLYGKKLPGIVLSMMSDIFFCFSDSSTGEQKFWWGTHPEALLKIIGQRNFDNLDRRVEPDFSKLYGERLCKPRRKEEKSDGV